MKETEVQTGIPFLYVPRVSSAGPYPYCYTVFNRKDAEYACCPLILCTPKRPNASKKTTLNNPIQSQKPKLLIMTYIYFITKIPSCIKEHIPIELEVLEKF